MPPRSVRSRGDLAAAVAPLRAILARSGATPEVHANLGVALRAWGETDEAADHLHRAVAARPDLAVAWYNLGLLEFERARYDQAATAYRRAIELAPHKQAWQSSYLCLLNYAPGYTPMQVLDAHREWAARLPARPARRSRRVPASRRLRIGYVSADLRGHSVAYFIAPVLEHHDRGRYEVFCYDNHPQPDEVTARLRASAEHRREVHALDDDALERLILQDEIDLLVDLSGHTLGNRRPVFARRPAPVQATWIGYPQTTGLPTIDYRITDAHLDPPGTTEAFGTEALWRMPDCAVCFLPPRSGAGGRSPARRPQRPSDVRLGQSVLQDHRRGGANVGTRARGRPPRDAEHDRRARRPAARRRGRTRPFRRARGRRRADRDPGPRRPGRLLPRARRDRHRARSVSLQRRHHHVPLPVGRRAGDHAGGADRDRPLRRDDAFDARALRPRRRGRGRLRGYRGATRRRSSAPRASRSAAT